MRVGAMFEATLISSRKQHATLTSLSEAFLSTDSINTVHEKPNCPREATHKTFEISLTLLILVYELRVQTVLLFLSGIKFKTP
jgi:hypothetical protein